MEGYRKERSSRQHLRIDVAAGGKESSLLLSNPMACSDISPGASSAGGHVTSNGDGGLSLLGRTSERASLRNKIRPKSPSLLRFFVRGSTRKSSADDDDGGGGGGGAGAGGSSGSDQDEAFSPRSSSTTPTPDMTHSNKYTDFHKASSGSVANHFATLPRKPRRRPVDSGFSSERDSVFLRDDGISQASIDTHSVSPDEDYHLGGLEALEMLHNQLQILVKQDCGEEVWGEGGGRMEDQMIIMLQRQLEDMQRSLDCLQQSDHNLRLSLRLAEQRAMESETKLSHSNDRCQRLEQRYILLACKYEALAKRHKELERHQQKQSVLKQMERTVSQNSIQQYSQLTRIHSQREYDRQRSESDLVKRPSSAQAIHPSPSLSHTETCV